MPLDVPMQNPEQRELFRVDWYGSAGGWKDQQNCCDANCLREIKQLGRYELCALGTANMPVMVAEFFALG